MKLHIDGTMRGQKVLVVINGQQCWLTHRSFKYLFKIAGALFMFADGWIMKEHIEQSYNYSGAIYNLKLELPVSFKPFIDNNKRGSYRLNLEKSQVTFNFENMKEFSDVELSLHSRTIRRAMEGSQEPA